MATYPTQKTQQAEYERLYIHGDALAEILAAGESVPNADTRRKIQILTARSHADFLQTLDLDAPRLIMDLCERDLLPKNEATTVIILEHTINNATAASIIEECRSGNFDNLNDLSGLLKYQVRLEDEMFKEHFTGAGTVPPTSAEIAEFFHQSHVNSVRNKLSTWRQRTTELDWLILFQEMVKNDVTPTEVEMTSEETRKFGHW